MKKIYSSIKILILLASVLLLPIHLSSQISYTFTPCGATGSAGPTQGQANTAYTLTNLSGSVSVAGGIQQFTIPVTGGYRVQAFGAKGFGTNCGRGATISGEFNFTAGQVIKILVGQQGAPPISPGTNQYGGGGGSFVTYTNNTPLVVAGGGGGSWAQTYTGLSDGTVSTTGGTGANGPTNGAGGTAGSGGQAAGSADGGGGLTGNGAGPTGGIAFINGGTGGAQYGHGGFGGGGGGSSWDNRRGCGGGGYSGGGGAGSTTTGYPEGGGGGSINNGTNQTNTSGSNNADGKVIITELCSISLSSSGASSSLSPVICSGTTLTLTTNGVSNYNWSDGNTTSSVIVVTPTVTTTYTVSAMSVSACIANAAITVTVSPGIPTITINASSTNTCLGTSITFTASGALTYTWTGGVTNAVPFVPTSTSGYTVTGANGCGSSTAATAVTLAPLPLSLAVSPTVVCAGNVATITAAAAANTFTWLPLNATGASSSLIVGPTANTIYTVTASNGTCNGTGTVALATIQAPTITVVTSASNICVGESVTLTANGGVNYTWSPGSQTGSVIVVTPSFPLLYSAVGDNSAGCLANASQGIVVNALPVINIAASSPNICSGSSVTLSVTGNSHSYVWSSGGTLSTELVTPISSTTYSVVGTDTVTNCQNTGTVEVEVYTPTISVAGSTVICNGNATNLTATGANNYTWSSGSQFATETLSPNITSTYTVNGITFTNNLSCPGSKTFQILVNPNPTVTVSSDRAEICKNESVTITAGGAQTYLWSNNETTPTITATSTLITTIFYTVTGTNAQGCATSTLVQVKVNSCTSILENKNQPGGFSVYPNPSRGELTLSADEVLEVTLINALGQVVGVINLNSNNNYTTDISGLSKGLYYFLAQAKSGTINHKVLVE